MKNIAEFLLYGRDNPISMDELSKRTGYDKRTVRQLIFNERCAGTPICSTCDKKSGGFYLASCIADVVPYLKMQRSRIKSAEMALEFAELYIKESSGSND